MRTLFLILSALLVVCLVSSTPIDPSRRLVNRPKDPEYHRLRRSPQHTKGGEAPIKGRVPLTRTPSLRKGEFLCGNKVCKLQPGEVPKNCNGVCQYPVALYKK